MAIAYTSSNNYHWISCFFWTGVRPEVVVAAKLAVGSEADMFNIVLLILLQRDLY